MAINPKNIADITDVLIRHGKDAADIIQFARDVMVKGVAAWNYTEKEVEHYTFKEAIAWIQEHFDKNKHNAASIVKEEHNGKIILKCCFLDKNKKPLSKLGDLFLKVSSNSICEDFINNFGDKNMIVIE